MNHIKIIHFRSLPVISIFFFVFSLFIVQAVRAQVSPTGSPTPTSLPTDTPADTPTVTPTDTPADTPTPTSGPTSGGGGGYFLKIDGIPGESTDEHHRDEIDVLSFSWGETQGGSRSGGGGTGKVSMQDFHFTMKYNKASVKLFLACAKGDHIPRAVLSIRKSGNQEDYLKWTLTDVMCSSYQTNGINQDIPTDSISLSFTKIEAEYKQQKPDGTFLPAVQAGWDLKVNKGM